MMTYSELLIKRRSIRNYQDKEVSLELIHEIIKESTLAPNARNDQPWKFIVITNKSMMKRISDECKSNLLQRISSDPYDYAKRYESLFQKEGYNVFYNAPAVVYFLGNKHLKNIYIDCTLSACYFMMSASSRGLGTCWINFATVIQSQDLLSELEIQDENIIIAPIILGYPTRIPKTPKRKEPEILKIIS